MNKKNQDTVEFLITRAVAEQVHRSLDVMRIRGWRFPEQCEVGVKMLAATALVSQVSVRIDDIVVDSTNISMQNPRADIAKVVDELVANWLSTHATQKPKTGAT